MNAEQITAMGVVITALVALLGAVTSFVAMLRTGRVQERVDGQHTAMVDAGIIKDTTIAAQATALGMTPTQALQRTPGVTLAAGATALPATTEPIPVKVIPDLAVPVTLEPGELAKALSEVVAAAPSAAPAEVVIVPGAEPLPVRETPPAP